MILILTETNLCPRSCDQVRVEKGEKLVEYCHLPDGEWLLKVRDGQLTECPLGKWDLKVEMGAAPPID